MIFTEKVKYLREFVDWYLMTIFGHTGTEFGHRCTIFGHKNFLENVEIIIFKLSLNLAD